ncbi:MAG: winged helix-turn-helix domain-containing protein [Myxococcota bacterium]
MSRPPLRLTACTVDLVRGVVDREGELDRLTGRELALLQYLSARPDQVVSRQTLLLEVWGYSQSVVSRAVDKTVTRLRAKIEVDRSAPDHVLTEYGTGFRFAPAGQVVTPPRPMNAAFFGRVSEQDALRSAVEGPDRLITVAGVAGMGKTMLVRQVLGETAIQLNLDNQGQEGLSEALVQHAEAAIVVVDCADHDLDPRPALSTALGQGGPTVVLTRRSPLQLRTERVIQLGPLDPEDAQAMLVERARRRRPGWGADPRVVGLICEAVGGWPLALEHLALRARLLTADALLDHIQTGDWLSGQGPADLSPRHQQLHRAIASMTQDLNAVALQVATEMSIFEGGASLEDVIAVVPSAHGSEGLRALEDLCRAGLVDVADDARLALFPPVRDHLRSRARKATNEPSWSTLEGRHLQTFARYRGVEIAAAIYRRGGPDLAQQICAEAPDIEAAMHRALRRQQPIIAANLASVLLGHAARAFSVERMARVLEAVAPIHQEVPIENQAALNLWTADHLARNGRFHDAMSLLERIEQECAAANLTFERASALFFLGTVQIWAWDPRAQATLEAAVQAHRAGGHNPSMSLQDLGWFHADRAHVADHAERAAQTLEEARRSAQAHGNVITEGMVTWGFANLAHLTHHEDEAWARCEAAVPTLVEMGRSLTGLWELQGRIATAQGRSGIAIEKLKQACAGRVQEGGFRHGRTLGYLADAQRLAGCLDDATLSVTEAERAARQVGAHALKPVLYQRGAVDLARGDQEGARAAWDEAEAIRTPEFARVVRLRQALARALGLPREDPREMH